jgi:octaprenyl-diphosphate synthase
VNVAIKDSVAAEFAQVDDVIVELLQSDVEMVENIGHYIVKAGGKRMRPLLVLLSAKALGGIEDAHIASPRWWSLFIRRPCYTMT